MGRLDSRSALVTGAGRGVGRGIALALARDGANVAVVELDPETARSTAQEIEALGRRAVAIECDVRTREACTAAVERTATEFGRLDILVNNASWSRPDVSFLDHTDEDMMQGWKVNAMATFWAMQAAHPHLAASGHGSVINLASGAGTSGMSGFASYAAAKEAVRALTRVAAREWGRQGIRVNVVCPYANSPGVEAWAADNEQLVAAQLAAMPLPRIGDCEQDIGSVVAFLASDEARYLTAHTFMVDGGSGFFR